MIYFLIIIFLCAQGVIFSSFSDNNSKATKRIKKMLSKCRNILEACDTPWNIKEELRVINQQSVQEETKSLLRDIALFTFLKKFPADFVNIFLKQQKQFTLEAFSDEKSLRLSKIKNMKMCPNHWVVIKILSEQDGVWDTEGFIGAKRLKDNTPMVLYNFGKREMAITNKYRRNWNNKVMWFKDTDRGDNKFYGMGLLSGTVDEITDIETTTEDIMSKDSSCIFEDGILSFEQKGTVIRTWKVIPHFDGRYVRRTKETKMRYLFVEDEEPDEGLILVLQYPLLLISASFTLQRMNDGDSDFKFFDFFRHGIRDIRENDDRSLIYLQSMLDEKYREFTMKVDEGQIFVHLKIDKYLGIYQDVVDRVQKKYPFSNWLKLQFSKQDDSISSSGALELIYGDELIPLPLEGVTDISSARCDGNQDSVTGGTNLVLKMNDQFFTVSSGDIISALGQDDTL